MTGKGRAAIYPADKTEREALVGHFKGRPLLGACPPKFRVPVVMRGNIVKNRLTEPGKDFEGGYEYDGFDVEIEAFATVTDPKAETLESFGVLLANTYRAFNETTHNDDMTHIFRALYDQYMKVLTRENLKVSEHLAHVQALKWLGDDICREVSFCYPDEEGEPGIWCVHERRGNRSDREWHLIGKGKTPFDAMLDAADRGNKGKKPYKEV